MFFILVLAEKENITMRCIWMGGFDMSNIATSEKDDSEFEEGFIHRWNQFENWENIRYLSGPNTAREIYHFLHRDLLKAHMGYLSSPSIPKLKVQVIESYKYENEGSELDDSQEVIKTPTKRAKTNNYNLRDNLKSPQRLKSDPIVNDFSEKKPDGIFQKNDRAISYFEAKSGHTETYTAKRLNNALIQNLSFALPDIVEINGCLKRH